MGSGKILTNSQKKRGLKNFTKDILAICHSPEILNMLEIEYIALYRSIGKAEYNLANGGHSGVKGYKTWTDGIHEMRCEDCPGEGWYRGRSEKCKKKNSEKRKGHAPTRGSKGMHWWNNGVEEKYTFECPGEGWVPGRFPSYGESMKGKLRESNKGFHWWTNGKEDVRAKERPGEGWVIGRNNQEAIRKISEKHRGRIGPRGAHWYTNGIINIRAIECPEGFHPGRSEECRKRVSEGTKRAYANGTLTHKGKNADKHWCHNETEEKFCVEIPDGWLPGRLSR
jgi:hypothetical protein